MAELPELIQALLDPKFYPGNPPAVELVQTQISYVFLAGDYVYKVKKPVDMGFLDYSTLEKRLFYCRKEIELNRRLCADTYLGVVPITQENGRYKVEGTGGALEYAVKMRRLPQDRLMDALLLQNKVNSEMAEQVAKIIADFHKKAATSPEITKQGGIEAVIKNTSENFDQTEKYFGIIIDPVVYERIKRFTECFIKDNRELFLKRMKDGKVRDCHGDLHANHICFTERGICIYDCIEFIDRLRYTDTTADIAFLAMDLDHYHRKDLAETFIRAYVNKSGDEEALRLLDFYKCYRAYVRGKVGCFGYDDPYISREQKDKIAADAANYFRQAESYIEE